MIKEFLPSVSPRSFRRRVALLGRRTTKAVAPLVPLRLLIRHRQPGPLVFFVHGIGQDKPFLNSLYQSHSPATFISMLDEILTCLKPLEDLSAESILHARSDQFIATFDDGLKSTYEHAVPILQSKGIPAIFFLNTAFLDNASRFYRFEAGLLADRVKNLNEAEIAKLRRVLSNREPESRPLDKWLLSVKYPERVVLDEVAEALSIDMKALFESEKPFMSTEQVKDLLSQGFYLGAHSIDHPRYSEISEEEQVRQTLLSVKDLSQRFSLAYNYFAFPFGSAGAEKSFFEKTSDEVDLYFTTGGWKAPDRKNKILHREGLDAVRSPYRYLQRVLFAS